MCSSAATMHGAAARTSWEARAAAEFRAYHRQPPAAPAARRPDRGGGHAAPRRRTRRRCPAPSGRPACWSPAMPLLQLMARLRTHGRRSPTRRRCASGRRPRCARFEARAEKAGLPADLIRRGSYALCASLDDLVLEHALGRPRRLGRAAAGARVPPRSGPDASSTCCGRRRRRAASFRRRAGADARVPLAGHARPVPRGCRRGASRWRRCGRGRRAGCRGAAPAAEPVAAAGAGWTRRSGPAAAAARLGGRLRRRWPPLRRRLPAVSLRVNDRSRRAVRQHGSAARLAHAAGHPARPRRRRRRPPPPSRARRTGCAAAWRRRAPAAYGGRHAGAPCCACRTAAVRRLQRDAAARRRRCSRGGEALKPKPARLDVVGFTDNRPVHTVLFPSAFQLSAARAQAVRAALRAHPGARAASRPRAAAPPTRSRANATAEGREQNRRIEIVLDGRPRREAAASRWVHTCSARCCWPLVCGVRPAAAAAGAGCCRGSRGPGAVVVWAWPTRCSTGAVGAARRRWPAGLTAPARKPTRCRQTAKALALLASNGRRATLAELPWYAIIGPPGAGKTTALLNAGLAFTLGEQIGPRPRSPAWAARGCASGGSPTTPC